MTFRKGTSGNPAGRPRDVSGVADLRRRLAKDAGDIIDKVVQAALSGDLQAAKLVIERLVPAVRPEAAPVVIAGLSGNLTQQAMQVLRQAAEGAIPISVAADFVAALARLVPIDAHEDLRARLAALEFGDLA